MPAQTRLFTIFAICSILISIAPTAVGTMSESESKEGIFLEVTLFTEVDLTEHGLPVDGDVVIAPGSEIPQTAPVPAQIIDRAAALSRSMPTQSALRVTEQQGAEGYYDVESDTLMRNVSLTPRSQYHNGTIDISGLFTEYNESTSDYVDPRFDDAEGFSRRQDPETAMEERTDGFRYARALAESLPQLSYHLKTKRIGVGVTFEGVPLGVAEPALLSGGTRLHDDPLDQSGAFMLRNRQAWQTVWAPAALPGPTSPDDQQQEVPSDHEVLAKLVDAGPGGIHPLVVAAGAATLAVIVLSLYSLFQPNELLRNSVRGKIFSAIEQNPGITVGQLAEVVGVKHQTVGYHVKFLKKAGYIVDYERGNRRLHFVNGAGLNEETRTMLGLSRDEATMKVLDAVAASPGIIKMDVARAVGLTRTAGAWHVNKLVKLGMIKETRDHGHCRLTVVLEKAEQLAEALRQAARGASQPTEIPVEAAPVLHEAVPNGGRTTIERPDAA